MEKVSVKELSRFDIYAIKRSAPMLLSQDVLDCEEILNARYRMMKESPVYNKMIRKREINFGGERLLGKNEGNLVYEFLNDVFLANAYVGGKEGYGDEEMEKFYTDMNGFRLGIFSCAKCASIERLMHDFERRQMKERMYEHLREFAESARRDFIRTLQEFTKLLPDWRNYELGD